MPQSKTFSLTIAEMREFASFTAAEQRFIERSISTAFARGPVPEGDQGGDRSGDQARAYRELQVLRQSIPSETSLDGVAFFVGALVRISVQDLASEQIDGFSAYRFLYERLLGAKARPFLPSAFCGAAALPQVRPCRRKMLLQSLSEAAATAPGWSDREPSFFPEDVTAQAA